MAGKMLINIMSGQCSGMKLNSSTIRLELFIYHQYIVFGGFAWVDIMLNKSLMMESPDPHIFAPPYNG